MSKTNEELKSIIVDLMVKNVMLKVPHGHCPYAYTSLCGDKKENCNDVEDCSECEKDFKSKLGEVFKKSVDKI